MTERPMYALSVKQPWAWLIIHGGKDIENRDWVLPARFVGQRVAIHASKAFRSYEWANARLQVGAHHIEGPMELFSGGLPMRDELEFGAILGTVQIVNCVPASPSPWFSGRYGFVLRDPVALPEPIPCKGALGFWRVPEDIARRIA